MPKRIPLTPEQAQDLVDHFGGQKAAAVALGFAPATIWRWRNPERSRAIARRNTARVKERYANDPEFRAHLLAGRRAYFKERYATDPEFREKHLKFYQRWYHERAESRVLLARRVRGDLKKRQVRVAEYEKQKEEEQRG